MSRWTPVFATTGHRQTSYSAPPLMPAPARSAQWLPAPDAAPHLVDEQSVDGMVFDVGEPSGSACCWRWRPPCILRDLQSRNAEQRHTADDDRNINGHGHSPVTTLQNRRQL